MRAREEAEGAMKRFRYDLGKLARTRGSSNVDMESNRSEKGRQY
jgi:hypothetical protein